MAITGHAPFIAIVYIEYLSQQVQIVLGTVYEVTILAVFASRQKTCHQTIVHDIFTKYLSISNFYSKNFAIRA